MSFKDNIYKTKRYIQRNGLSKTVFAVAERVLVSHDKSLDYEPVSFNELMKQRKLSRQFSKRPLISILVPAYNTDSKFFLELLQSVVGQTYENWELIIADASVGNDNVEKTCTLYKDSRIRYIKLSQNMGISENTNVALTYATGEYIGLLDHDDLLTPECLFYVACTINEHSNPVLIYTDEDKTDADAKTFFEPNRKRDYNPDLLMTNNYFCHFTCIRSDVIKRLRFRREYDGAQDFDLFLRCVSQAANDEIIHIPKICYHWRCHEMSTAGNTDSKVYAYENGKAAIEDFLREKNWEADVINTDHLGFYRIEYKPDIFLQRPEVGAVAGPIVKMGRVVSGALTKTGNPMYTMPFEYSGYMHRAKLQQRVHAADIRNMIVCPELQVEFEVYLNRINNGEDVKSVSLEFANKLAESNLMIIYDPLLKLI